MGFMDATRQASPVGPFMPPSYRGGLFLNLAPLGLASPSIKGGIE